MAHSAGGHLWPTTFSGGYIGPWDADLEGRREALWGEIAPTAL